MKAVSFAASFGLALAGLPAITMAACGAPSVRVTALATLLQGNTACVPPVTQPTMIWQELHQTPNALVDYKRGPSDTVDPSKTVGIWSVAGDATRGFFVTYSYGNTGTSPPFTGGTYTYSVWDNGDGTHSFCSANPEIKGRIKTGAGAC